MSSTTIDERVVSLQFDNRQFEKNVSTTMSTLEKLKQKLNFSGASKGLEEINKQAGKTDLKPVSSAVEKLSLKFSAMQVMGVTALANITNSAVNAGKKIVSALTIDPIKTGFQEYETQMNAVQTILANTSSKGTTIDDVNKALDDLNKYADQTIYNFTEMTRNIGTFTAAGVDLDTSTSAIKGIANLAAVSGSTSQQASTAMYQLSQALAAGKVSLMDWNSVVNAGMGGEVFQNALKRTSEVMGTGAEEAIAKFGSFRESLTQGEWLTTDVLTETLNQFTMAAEEGTKQWEEYKKSLMEKGYTEDQAVEILKMANTATDAATKVKTFTQLWDVLKESAQSGWSQTWKLIIGDFEEAKALLTPLADVLTGFINKMSNARNFIVGGVMDFATPWSGIVKKLRKVQETVESVTKVTDKLEHFQKVVNDVWAGDYKNSDTGRFELLEQAGYDSRVVQELVNKGQEYKLTTEDIEAAHKKFGLTMKTTTEETKAVTTALYELDEETLRNAGLTEDEIRLYKDLAKGAEKYGMTMDELAKEMSENSGRDLLIDSFKNLGSTIISVFKAIGGAWSETFEPTSIVNVYMALKQVNQWTLNLRKSIEVFDETTGKFTGELTENGEKLVRTFKGIFAIIDLVATVAGGGLKIAFKVLTTILGYFDMNILDLTAGIGDLIVGFRDWVDSALDITKVLDVIVPIVGSAIKAVKGWIGAFKNLPIIGDFIEDIQDTFNKIKGMDFTQIGAYIRDSIQKSLTREIDGPIGVMTSYIGKFIATVRNEFVKLKDMDFSEIGAYLIDGFKRGLTVDAGEVIDKIIEFGKNILNSLKEILGIHSPSKETEEIGGFFMEGFIVGIQNGLSKVIETVKTIGSSIIETITSLDWGGMFAGALSGGMIFALVSFMKALNNLTAPLAGVGDMLGGVGELLGGVGDVLSKSAKKIKKILNSVSKVVTSFSKVLNAQAFKIRTEGFKNLAISIAIIAGSLYVLSTVDQDDLKTAGNAIGQIAIVMVGLAWAIDKIGGASTTINKEGINIDKTKGILLSLGAAILMIGITAKMIGKLDADQYKQAMVGMLAIMGGMVALLIFMTPLKNGEHVKGVGKTLLNIGKAMLILAIVLKLIATMEWGELGKGAAFMVGFLIFVAALSAINRFIGDIADVGETLLTISKAMLILAIVLKLIATMEWGELGKGAAFMVGFLIFVAALTAIRYFMGGIADVGKTLLAISGAMLILTIVIKLIATMEWKELGKGAVFMGAFVLFVLALSAISKFVGDIGAVGKTLLAISGAMLIIVVVMKLIGGMKPENIAKGVAGLLGLTIVVGLLIAIVKRVKGDAPKIALTLLALSVAIGILAAICIILSFVSWDGLAKGVIAIGFLSIFMKGMIKATRGANDVKSSIMAMAVAIGVMAATIIILSFIDPKKLIGPTIAMSALMGMFALILKSSKDVTKSMGTLIVMTVAIGVMAAVIYLLSNIPIENALGAAASLSVLMLSMSIALKLISKVGMMGSSALIGVAALLLMAVPLLAFVGVLALAQNIQNAMANTQALILLAGALTLLLLPLTLVGTFAISALLGVTALLLMAVPLLAFVGVLALMQNIQNASANVLLLITLMTTLTSCLVSISLVAPLAVLGVAAMAALTGLIVAVGVLVTAVGALMTEFPQLETFIDTGIPILVKLATGLGEMISGFMTGLTSGLPEIGMSLGMFMVNATPFILGAKMVDDSVLAGVGILTAAVLALTAADFLEGIVSFLSGGTSFSTLGTELSAFITNAMPFIMMSKMIDPSIMEGVKSLAEAVLILTGADILEGLTSWFAGGSSLADFGAQLGGLGANLNSFVTNLGTFSDDQVVSVNCAGRAIKALADAASTLPNEGGWAGKILGENSLATFGAYLPGLGTQLNAFITNLGTFGDDSVTTVDCAGRAIKALADAASTIPNEGGWAAKILGDNSLATFGAYLPGLGTQLNAFITNLGTFGDESISTVDCAGEAIKILSEAADAIPNNGGLWGKIFGENSLATFGSYLPGLGMNLNSFITNLGTFDDTAIQTVNCAGEAIKTLAGAANTIPGEGGLWSKIFGDNSLATFSSYLPDLGTNLATFATNLGTMSDQQVSTVYSACRMIEAMAGLGSIDMKEVSNNLGKFGDKLVNFGDDMSSFSSTISSVGSDTISSAITKTKDLIDLAKTAASTNVNSLKTFGKSLKDVAKNDVKGFAEEFSGESPKSKVKKAIKALIDALIKGAKDKKGDVGKAFETVADKGLDAVESSSLKSSFESAGSNLVDGFCSGISANAYKAEAKAAAMASAAYQAAKDELDINSPSKIFAKLGSGVVEGFVKGIDDNTGDSDNAATSMADTTIHSFSKAMNKVYDILNGDIDAQPTIRPILDLSDVNAGANSLNSMFAVNPAIGVSANLGAISSSMSKRQNGATNNDVVSAIDGLRKSMGEIGNTVYNVNGITYDDGSNVSNAVESLIRAARVQRRI
ncbi:MAG: tape measure protein [Ruminococcus sp.]|nr:tape measure protein [Ruminococcus sp.]